MYTSMQHFHVEFYTIVTKQASSRVGLLSATTNRMQPPRPNLIWWRVKAQKWSSSEPKPPHPQRALLLEHMDTLRVSSLSRPYQLPRLTMIMAAHTGMTTHFTASAFPVAQTLIFTNVTLRRAPTAQADYAGTWILALEATGRDVLWD